MAIVYMVKWQCSFKYSGSSHRLVNTTASWSCPGSNSGLLGSWTADKHRCWTVTWTRRPERGPADVKYGESCCLCVSRLGTCVHVRCVVKVLFRRLYFEIGVLQRNVLGGS